MAKGPGICQGDSIDPVSILDVAPMLLYNLGLPFPEEMEGHMPLDIFEPSYLQQNPIKVSGHSDSVAPAEQQDKYQVVFDAEAEAKVAERLRALGYIE